MAKLETPVKVRSEPPRRPWAAFLLNFLLPPGGYIYAGYPRMALVVIATFVCLVAAILVWTIEWPPGVYAVTAFPRGTPELGELVVAWTAAALLGCHAAWLCRFDRRTLARAFPRWITIIATWPVFLVLAFAFRLFGPVPIYSVASQSMAPTLSPGDIVLARGARALCGNQSVHPGDVVFYRRDRTTFVSRALAHGGQQIALRAGVPIIDGKPLVQKRIGPVSGLIDDVQPERVVSEKIGVVRAYNLAMLDELQPQDNTAVFVVPKGYWFVLGDSRDNSLDSRFKGPVADGDVCGVAIKVLYSRYRGRIGRRP